MPLLPLNTSVLRRFRRRLQRLFDGSRRQQLLVQFHNEVRNDIRDAQHIEAAFNAFVQAIKDRDDAGCDYQAIPEADGISAAEKKARESEFKWSAYAYEWAFLVQKPEKSK